MAGSKLFSRESGGIACLLGKEIEMMSAKWQSLYHAYHIIFGNIPLEWSKMDPAAESASISAAFNTTWFQRQEKEMLPQGPADRAVVHSFAPLLGGEEPVSTRFLFECAALLDESCMLGGPYPQAVPGSLVRMNRISFESEYGEPYRVAQRVAGRSLSASEVMTLIDFALNPPIPGLSLGATSMDWREIYPPYRFLFAAYVLGSSQTSFELNQPEGRPPAEAVASFYHEVSNRTDICMGAVDAIVSRDSSLREAVDPSRSFVERIPGMAFLCAEKLKEERIQDLGSIAHFGSLMSSANGIRLIDTQSKDYPWWFFPQLGATDDGELTWPSERISIDEATDLALGAAFSSAYDDVVYGDWSPDPQPPASRNAQGP